MLRVKRAVLLLWSVSLLAQSPVRQWRSQHEREILEEFAQLIRLPNVSRDLVGMRANAALLEELYARHGVKLQRLEVPDAAPALFGELKIPDATKTVVFYAHYDGQPVDADKWINKAPFQPELRDAAGKLLPWPAPGSGIDPEWRLYGRSSGDDRAPIIAFLAALDALKSSGSAPSVNLKFFFDAEEEMNWPHLAQILTQNKALLASDGWLLYDAPVHQSRRQQLIFGARTQLVINLGVYGARTELHAGHYGNFAPNPALMLTQLIASMKDENGRVRIRNFDEGVTPLTAAEKAALHEFPDIEPLLRDEFAIGGVEAPGRRIEEAITRPALTVLSLNSGGAGSVIPAKATASFRIDLVKGMDPIMTLERFKAHIRERGYTVLDHEPNDAERRRHTKIASIQSAPAEAAVRTPMDSPFAKQVIAAVEAARGPVLKLPNMGAGIPINVIDRVLGAPAVIVPIANHDDNQHTQDENLRLQNLWDGIETIAALMRM